MKKSTLLRSLLTLLVMAVWGGANGAMAQEEASIDFSAQGYTNAFNVSEVAINSVISVTFTKGDASNAPSYYNSGTAVRVYAKGYFTVSAVDGYTLTKITLGFGSGDKTNAITVDTGLYSAPTWSGSANAVVFTIGGTKDHRRIKTITVEYTSGGATKNTQTLTFPQATYTAEIGTPFETPTLTGAQTNVEYTSSNEAVATVDNNGDITLISKGSTIITATAIEDDNYYGAQATYTLKVKEPLPAKTIWFEDFSSNSLEQYTTTGSGTKIYENDTYAQSEAPELLLAKGGGTFTATINDLKGYSGTFTLTFNSNNGVSTIKSETEGVEVSNISFAYPYGNYEVYVPEGTSSLSLTFTNNETDKNTRLDDILLAHKYNLQTLNISSVGYATYCSDKTYIMPTTMKGGAVSVEGNTASIDFYYTQNVLVPAGMGLLISGAEGEHKFFVTDRDGNTTYEGINLLQGALTNDVITAPTGTLLYILANDSESGLGFYWQKNSNNGQQVQNMAGKAYLQVPTTSAVQGFRLNLGDTTGISAVETTNGNAPVYTLSGMRVNGNLNNLPAGIYIVGGKKVYVK